jgi:TrmH family RNA methyltransferase
LTLIRVVLVSPEGRINIGFAARTAMNFGADELWIVDPRAPIDEEAKRYAAKAKAFLEKAVIVDSLEEALKGMDVAICTTSKKGGRHDILRHPVTPSRLAELVGKWGSMALVFGRESTGLTRRELSLCDIVVTIPANPEYPVLNLSHAVAVVLYELWKKRMGSPDTMYEKADAGMFRLAEEKLGLLLGRLGVREPRRTQVLLSFKRLLFQAAASRKEVQSILYLLNKCLAKAGGSSEDTPHN